MIRMCLLKFCYAQCTCIFAGSWQIHYKSIRKSTFLNKCDGKSCTCTLCIANISISTFLSLNNINTYNHCILVNLQQDYLAYNLNA
jgi:hypothetical protein